MNTFMNTLKDNTNFKYTEKGDVTHKTSKSDVLDMFALGGSYRNRDDNDVILLFKNAYEENPELALKCLFYLRDIRGGQGERRFFRVAFKWLCEKHIESAKKNLVKVTLLNGTIPHEVERSFGGAQVLMKPAAPGTGLKAGGAMRAVLESVGVTDVIAKSKGSSNAHNLVKATIAALSELRDAYTVAGERGISMNKVFNG